MEASSQSHEFSSRQESLEDLGLEQEIDLGEPSGNPFDPAEIRFQIRVYTVDLVVSRIKESELDLAPGYQRGMVWNEVTQSRFIESLLIKIPIPTFYIDAEREDRWAVIDGLQRLSTLKRFILDKALRLKGLEFKVLRVQRTMSQKAIC